MNIEIVFYLHVPGLSYSEYAMFNVDSAHEYYRLNMNDVVEYEYTDRNNPRAKRESGVAKVIWRSPVTFYNGKAKLCYSLRALGGREKRAV